MLTSFNQQVKSFSECVILLEGFFLKKKTVFFYFLDADDSLSKIPPSDYDTYIEFWITKIPIILIVEIKKMLPQSVQV